MKRSHGKTVVATRVTDEELERLRVIAEKLSDLALGTPIGIPTGLKHVLESGLPIVERKLGIKSATKGKAVKL